MRIADELQIELDCAGEEHDKGAQGDFKALVRKAFFAALPETCQNHRNSEDEWHIGANKCLPDGCRQNRQAPQLVFLAACETEERNSQVQSGGKRLEVLPGNDPRNRKLNDCKEESDGEQSFVRRCQPFRREIHRQAIEQEESEEGCDQIDRRGDKGGVVHMERTGQESLKRGDSEAVCFGGIEPWL